MISIFPEVEFQVDYKSGGLGFVMCLVEPKKAPYRAHANKQKFLTVRIGWFKVVSDAEFQGNSEYPGLRF